MVSIEVTVIGTGTSVVVNAFRLIFSAHPWIMARSVVPSVERRSNFTSEMVSRVGAREVTATVTVPVIDDSETFLMQADFTVTEQRRDTSMDSAGMERPG
jgi:hypothetical protein